MTSIKLPAQQADNDLLKSCLESIYAMNFDNAKLKLNQYSKKYSNHTSRHLLKAYYLRWRHSPIIKNDTELYSQFMASLDSAESSANLFLKTKKNDPEESYYKMTAHIMRAELHAVNDDFVKAALEGKNAFGIIKKGFDWCSNYPEFNISTGLYNYYIEFYRDKGFFYQSLLWPFSKGYKKEGLNYLKVGSEKATFSKVECQLYLSHLYFKMENDPETGLKYIESLRGEFPNNSKFVEMHTENLIALNRYDQAKKVLASQAQNSNNFFHAKRLLFKGMISYGLNSKIDSTKKLLNSAIKEIEKLPGDNDHYLSLAYLTLAKIELNQNELDRSESLLKEAKSLAKYTHTKNQIEKIETRL